MNRISGFIFLIFAAVSLPAQTTGGPPMADLFRADGKIWVVIAVIVIIFLAIVAWLVLMDRRIASLEQQSREKGQPAEKKSPVSVN